MKYRVIEGGFWRHGTLHIESDCNVFESNATGRQLYIEMTEWLIENSDRFGSTYNLGMWPEFWGVYNTNYGIIDFMVGEESSMWFVAETCKYYDAPVPEEGVMDSWLHGDGDKEKSLVANPDPSHWDSFPDFWDLFPEGHPSVLESLPGSYTWEHARPLYEERRKKTLAKWLNEFGKIVE